MMGLIQQQERKAGTVVLATLRRGWWLTLLALLAQYRFDHWTADNGLPQNSVRDIVQMRDGYLWLTDGMRCTAFSRAVEGSDVKAGKR